MRSPFGIATTWKVGLVYTPVSDLTFRVTRSRDVRAPTAQESSPNSTTIQLPLPDPFVGGNTNQFVVTGGNPNLGEETARTWTAGAVLRPRFIPGLTVAVDWYDIKLRDAVNTATSQEVTELCVDQPTLSNVFCANVERDPATGFVAEVFAGPQNVANFDTAGLDVTIDWTKSLGKLGKFNVHVVGGYLDKLTFISSQGADLDDDVNEQFSPRYQATGDVTWTMDKFSVNYGLAWFGKTKRYTTEQLRGNPDISDPRYFLYKARWEHDIQFRFAPEEGMSVYFGINNFTDQKPDIAVTSYPVSAVGRYFYAGARFRFGGKK